MPALKRLILASPVSALALLALMAFSHAAPARADETSQTIAQDASAEVSALFQRVVDNYNACDLDAFSDDFADGAYVFLTSGELVAKAAYIAALEGSCANPPGLRQDSVLNIAEPAMGDTMAMTYGYWAEASWSDTPEAGYTYYRITLTAVATAQGWRISHFHLSPYDHSYHAGPRYGPSDETNNAPTQAPAHPAPGPQDAPRP